MLKNYLTTAFNILLGDVVSTPSSLVIHARPPSASLWTPGKK